MIRRQGFLSTKANLSSSHFLIFTATSQNKTVWISNQHWTLQILSLSLLEKLTHSGREEKRLMMQKEIELGALQARTDESSQHILSIVQVLWDLLTLGWQALVWIFQVIGAAFFCLETLISIWVIQQVYMYFRGSGKATEMKREAATSTMMASL